MEKAIKNIINTKNIYNFGVKLITIPNTTSPEELLEHAKRENLVMEGSQSAKIGFFHLDGSMSIKSVASLEKKFLLDVSRGPLLEYLVLFSDIVPAAFDHLIYDTPRLTHYDNYTMNVIRKFLYDLGILETLEKFEGDPTDNDVFQIIDLLKCNSIGLSINGLSVNIDSKIHSIIDKRIQSINDVCTDEILCIDEDDPVIAMSKYKQYGRRLMNVAYFHEMYPDVFSEKISSKDFINESKQILNIMGIRKFDYRNLHKLFSLKQIRKFSGETPIIVKSFSIEKIYLHDTVLGKYIPYCIYKFKDDSVKIPNESTGNEYVSHEINDDIPSTTISIIQKNELIPSLMCKDRFSSIYEKVIDAAQHSKFPKLWKFAVNHMIKSSMSPDDYDNIMSLSRSNMEKIRDTIDDTNIVLYANANTIIFLEEIPNIESVLGCSIGGDYGQWTLNVMKGNLHVCDVVPENPTKLNLFRTQCFFRFGRFLMILDLN